MNYNYITRFKFCLSLHPLLIILTRTPFKAGFLAPKRPESTFFKFYPTNIFFTANMLFSKSYILSVGWMYILHFEKVYFIFINVPKKAVGDMIPVLFATTIAMPDSRNGTVKSTSFSRSRLI